MSSGEDHPGKHHTFVFDTVITNVGNGYIKFSGMLTAPVSGLYAVTCSTIMNGRGAYAAYDIVKNAEIVGAFFVDAEYSSEVRSSAMTVIVLLQVGDVLFVRTSSTYTPHGNVVSDVDAPSYVAGLAYSINFKSKTFFYICHFTGWNKLEYKRVLLFQYSQCELSMYM